MKLSRKSGTQMKLKYTDLCLETPLSGDLSFETGMVFFLGGLDYETGLGFDVPLLRDHPVKITYV